MKPKLHISLSGGRSSAVMTMVTLLTYEHTHEIIITFANTGCEHYETYEFIHKLELLFGWPIVWLEAVVDPIEGNGIGNKVVDYYTAARDGSPFRDVVSKYGIFNMTNPSCTDRLKTNVMRSYLKSKGFIRGKKLNYQTAIGIRADEIDRVSKNKDIEGYIYPLADAGITKRDVGLIIKRNWGFDLKIPSDAYGNCVWCWKKSKRKLMTLAQEDVSIFNFPKSMEHEFGTLKADSAAGHNGRRYWFRGNETADNIIASSYMTDFQHYIDDPYEHGIIWDNDLDIGPGCGESCEMGADE